MNYRWHCANGFAYCFDFSLFNLEHLRFEWNVSCLRSWIFANHGFWSRTKWGHHLCWLCNEYHTGCHLGSMQSTVIEYSFYQKSLSMISNSPLFTISPYLNRVELRRLAVQQSASETPQAKTAANVTSNATSLVKLEPKIYNVTSKKDGVTWGKISDDMKNLLLEYPTMKRFVALQLFWYLIYFSIPKCVLHQHLVASAEHNELSSHRILPSAFLSRTSRLHIRLCTENYEQSATPTATVSENAFVHGEVAVLHDTRMGFR